MLLKGMARGRHPGPSHTQGISKDLVIKYRWAKSRLWSLHVVKVIAAFKLFINVNTKLASVKERDMSFESCPCVYREAITLAKYYLSGVWRRPVSPFWVLGRQTSPESVSGLLTKEETVFKASSWPHQDHLVPTCRGWTAWQLPWRPTSFLIKSICFR